MHFYCTSSFASIKKSIETTFLLFYDRPIPPPTMFASLLLALNVPFALTSALPPSNGEDQTIQLSHLDQLLPANVSKDDPATGFNASNNLRIQCDGEKYGFNPNVTDCQDARAYYKRSSRLFTYGERHSGHSIEAFPLPFRLMGGKL